MSEANTSKVGLLLNSTALFIFSYISIRAILYANKFILAKIYNIETIRIKFVLRGISPADSGVWDYLTVLTFYSVELFTLIAIILFTYLLFVSHKRKSGVYKYTLFWFLVTANIILFSTLVSGILTRTNVFHFFNWLHMPYAIGVVMAFVLILVELVLGRRFSNYFLRFAMPMGMKYEKNYFGFLPKYLITAFLPMFIGLILLYLPNIQNMFKYDYIEIFTVFVFFLAGFIFKYDIHRKVQNDNISKLNVPVIAFSILAYFSFIFIEVF